MAINRQGPEEFSDRCHPDEPFERFVDSGFLCALEPWQDLAEVAEVRDRMTAYGLA